MNRTKKTNSSFDCEQQDDTVQEPGQEEDLKKKMSLRTTILTLICLQNAGYSLIRKYSVANEAVSPKEILFIGEVLKIIIAMYMILVYKEPSDSKGEGIRKLSWLIANSSKMIVLSGIYGAMNILSFVALQYIGAGEFTICAQLKILSTAGFSVLVLGTSLSAAKWRALLLLVFGCLLVASPAFNHIQPKEGESQVYVQFFGYIAVLTEVLMSGFASIYFEKVVKSTTEVVSIWERNFQLAFYSLIIYGGFIVYENAVSVNTNVTPWSNWSFLTFCVSLVGAVGGLLVAATLKYADSILKTLAAAGAIVISTVAGHYLLDGPLDLVMSIGAGVTILSIANYAFDS